MKIAEYKQIDTKIVEEEVLIPADYEQNENGETVMVTPEHTETIRKEVPIMGMVYRNATPEEEAEALAAQAEAERQEALREPTLDERMNAVEEHNAEQDLTIDDMVLLMADMIGGI